ncbi:Nup107 [Trypoxylus dichotomus]
MDTELSRSIRLLDDSISSQGGRLFKRGLFKTQKVKGLYKDNVSTTTLTPEELEYLNESHGTQQYNTSRLINNDISSRLISSSYGRLTNFNITSTASVIEADQPWENAVNSLYVEFLEVMQTHMNSQAVLDMVRDLACCCSDTLNIVKTLKSKVAQVDADEDWLENERNTWRLVFALYQDRLGVQSMQTEDEEYDHYYGLSEKLCTINLFKRDQLVRETQLVIDWLESNAAEKYDKILYFSDNTVGWENTLHQLSSKDTIVFASTREIVTELHPDAPAQQRRPLHDMDIEDNKRLCHSVFTGIRCGKLSEAQKLCVQCGHAWKAALLDGWKLHHDPTKVLPAENTDDESNEMVIDNVDAQRIEGNENRDLWKRMAFKYCEQIQPNKYEKAAVGIYCGYLRHVLPVCNDWNDYLWAYLKVMIDIRVESEIRDCVQRKYQNLPDYYWDQRMSLNDIFGMLDASNNEAVSIQAHKPEHVIQKHLILDEISELFRELERYVSESDVSTQFVRLATHLVLFMDQIGRFHKKDTVEKILETYIQRLSQMDDAQLVAFYVSKMSSSKQVQLYSAYLEKVTDDNERLDSLKYAENCGLDVDSITRSVVESIRSKPIQMLDATLQQRLTSDDEYKISAIDWLLFYEQHRSEAVIQSNALICTFLMSGKLDAAQLIFNKIPSDSIDKILAEGEVAENIKQAVKEHLSYKSYLDAQEAFNVWFKHFKSKPMPPESISEDAHLTEKVAYQHRMSQFKAETERWKLTISHLAKSAKTLLYNVLLFPEGGWLTGAVEADYLRSTCIPECVLLLYTVLFESKLLNECVQLADILASKKYRLYKVMSTQKLEEIVTKLTECSVALLEERKDPWGNETSL